MAAIALIPIAVALIATVLGRAARDENRRWLDRRLLVMVTLMTLVAATLAIVGIDPEVPRGEAYTGVAIAAVFLGALPVIAYYTVGYLVRPWWLLAIVLVVLAVATFFYLFFGLLIVADYVYCPPDAHECPL